jgi:hypothetical protein
MEADPIYAAGLPIVRALSGVSRWDLCQRVVAAEGMARTLSALLERMAFEGGEGPWAIEPRAALAAWEKWKKVEKKAEEKAEKTKGGNRCR